MNSPHAGCQPEFPTLTVLYCCFVYINVIQSNFTITVIHSQLTIAPLGTLVRCAECIRYWIAAIFVSF